MTQATTDRANRLSGDTPPKRFLELILPTQQTFIEPLPRVGHQVPPNNMALEDGEGRFKRSQGRIQVTYEPPPDRDWSIEGILLAESVTVLAGLGGVSKTMLAIMLAIHVAIGRAWAGRTVKAGGAILFLGEETPAEVIRRVNAACIALDLTEDEKRQVETNLLVFGLAGEDIRLTTLDGGNPTASGVGDEIIQVCREHEFATSTPVRMVAIDHAKLVMGGDPNAAQDVTELTRVLTAIAGQTNAAVLLLAHSPKASVGNEGKATVRDVAGNAAFVDNARIGLALRTMRDDEGKGLSIEKAACGNYALLENFKNNYAATGDVTWMVRRAVESHKVAVPLPVILTPPPPTVRVPHTLEAKILDFIAGHPGQFSKTQLRDKESGKRDGQLKASKKDIESAVDALLANGKVVNREPTKEERSKFALHHNVQSVLDVARP